MLGCTRNKDRMKAGAQPSNKGEIQFKAKENGRRNDNEGCEGDRLRDRSSPAEASNRSVSTGTGVRGLRTRNKSGK